MRKMPDAADDRPVVSVKNGEVVFQDVETAAVMRRAPACGRWPGKLFALAADDRRIMILGFRSDDPIGEWDLEAA